MVQNKFIKFVKIHIKLLKKTPKSKQAYKNTTDIYLLMQKLSQVNKGKPVH